MVAMGDINNFFMSPSSIEVHKIKLLPLEARYTFATFLLFAILHAVILRRMAEVSRKEKRKPF
jgi:hypothetical protein